MANASAPPRVLVTVETSSPTLSKSGTTPFTITLIATVDGDSPITADAPCTILLPGTRALDYQGLIFKDTETGTLASRVVVDVHYRPPEYLSIATASVIEIPPSSAGEAYSVSHTFYVPQVSSQPQADSPSSSSSSQSKWLLIMNQVSGFTVGRAYEIGLGNDMSRIWWWEVGTKRDVFAGGRQRGNVLNYGTQVDTVLTNVARFKVVQ
ncbi:hypothetical protein LTR36_002641 [Oleoguttula mirabilis]|uniref:Uncharacterized protein n=1 Tax=Oleoguttula mirabilis TaxID=1507867 RepID=A0AAV9JKG7_9PEZI|nr:hypothetical protein LTR36_002641 [Oleoguttula mirabilis]